MCVWLCVEPYVYVYIFLGKVTALGVLCCFALFVCLTLLASFIHLSFKNMYMYMYIHKHMRERSKYCL